jgi:hypothetical protein
MGMVLRKVLNFVFAEILAAEIDMLGHWMGLVGLQYIRK